VRVLVGSQESVGPLAKQSKKSRRSGSSGKSASKAGTKKAGTRRKTSRTAAARKKVKKASSKKSSSKKAGKKKSSGRKTGKKATGKKASGKKKTTKKAGAKKTAKASKKPSPKTKKKKTTPSAGSGKGEAKGSSGSKAAGAKTPAKAPEGGKSGDSQGDSKGGRKGITIVNQRRGRGGASQKKPVTIPKLGSILGPGSPPRKPLIPSGPPASGDGADEETGRAPSTSKLSKRDIERFRKILLAKRAELVGDLSTLEDEALRSQSGGLSHLPQHMADQGSDASDQSLSLDLAAADRRLIKEIDDALGRIAAGTYGVCEVTGEPIRKERLEELPWARLSIQAARDLERRGR